MKNRKAFTLVELLVVIAILAVLATVSIVGYTSFSQKAKDSNALTELTQVRDVMNAELLEGEYVFFDDNNTPSDDSDDHKYAFKVAGGALECNDVIDPEHILPVTIDNALIKKCFPEIASLKGTFTLSSDFKRLAYEFSDGGKAEWTIATGKVENVD